MQFLTVKPSKFGMNLQTCASTNLSTSMTKQNSILCNLWYSADGDVCFFLSVFFDLRENALCPPGVKKLDKTLSHLVIDNGKRPAEHLCEILHLNSKAKM